MRTYIQTYTYSYKYFNIFFSWARRHYIFCIYLRSQASTEDQPEDNGINAHWKGIFDDEYTDYMGRFPGLQFTRHSLNVVLSNTNARFLVSPRLSSIIKHAWEVTKLFPFAMPISA